MLVRPRRLRNNEEIRKMARETRISKDSLIYPIFLKDGTNIKDEIKSMTGQFHYSVDRVSEEIEKSLKAGVNKFILFGIPEKKDEVGSQAFSENGIIQKGLRKLRTDYSDIILVSDVCMCEYTSHGHCGIVENEYVKNDISADFIAKIALSHMEAGADIVAPSDMMDGRISKIRRLLEKSGFENSLIMSYAVKYASSFYGPFREAVNSAPSFGDRKTYQMDYHNKREAIKEAKIDAEEGADILIVKPALSYLDIICEVKKNTTVPVAAYSVSGEYAMMKLMAKAGMADEYKIMCESSVSIFRAGADILITYFAKELAGAIKKGDMG